MPFVEDNSKVRKSAKIRTQCNQAPQLTKDTTWESDKITIRHNKQEPIGQPFPSRWPQGSNEQTRKHDKHKLDINNTNDPQMKYHLETVSKIFYLRA